jgi:hypothetical protein
MVYEYDHANRNTTRMAVTYHDSYDQTIFPRAALRKSFACFSRRYAVVQYVSGRNSQPTKHSSHTLNVPSYLFLQSSLLDLSSLPL